MMQESWCETVFDAGSSTDIYKWSFVALWLSAPSTAHWWSPSLCLSLPFACSFCLTTPHPTMAPFSSIQANPMTQNWRTLCKTLNIMEGSTTMSTSTTTTTIMATSLTMQTGKMREWTISTPICSRQWRLAHSRIRVPTAVYRKAGVWSLTYRPPSVPPGPRVHGVDLTHTTIMR